MPTPTRNDVIRQLDILRGALRIAMTTIRKMQTKRKVDADAFRCGHATVQHHGGVHDKPIQRQMRHSESEITRDVYMQQVDPETWSAVVDWESRVNEKKQANAATA